MVVCLVFLIFIVYFCNSNLVIGFFCFFVWWGLFGGGGNCLLYFKYRGYIWLFFLIFIFFFFVWGGGGGGGFCGGVLVGGFVGVIGYCGGGGELFLMFEVLLFKFFECVDEGGYFGGLGVIYFYLGLFFYLWFCFVVFIFLDGLFSGGGGGGGGD